MEKEITQQSLGEGTHQAKPTIKIILIAISILIILAGVFLMYKTEFIKSWFRDSINSSDLEDEDGKFEAFYYTVDESLGQDSHYKIFKVSPNLSRNDINTHSFTIPAEFPRVITDSWEKNTILFLTNSEKQSVVYSLDVSLDNSQPKILMTIPLDANKREKVQDARIVDGGIAYITAGEKNARAENSVLTFVSKDQKRKDYFLSEKSPLYAGFGFLTRESDKSIILHEMGGDAGMIWSQWYRIDRETGIVQKLGDWPPSSTDGGGEYPVFSAFNPSRSEFAYVDFSGGGGAI